MDKLVEEAERLTLSDASFKCEAALIKCLAGEKAQENFLASVAACLPTAKTPLRPETSAQRLTKLANAESTKLTTYTAVRAQEHPEGGHRHRSQTPLE